MVVGKGRPVMWSSRGQHGPNFGPDVSQRLLSKTWIVGVGSNNDDASTGHFATVATTQLGQL